MSVNVDQSKLTRALTVPNRLGLHVRAARLLFQTCSQYTAVITVAKGDLEIDCKSVFEMLALGAAQGDELIFCVAGDDAQDAMTAIEELFAANFHEED